MTPKAPGRPVSMPAYHLLLRTTAGPVTRSSPAAHGRSGGFPSHCGVRFCKASPCKWTCSRLSGSAAPDEANCRVSLRRGRAGEERRQTSWSRKQPPPHTSRQNRKFSVRRSQRNEFCHQQERIWRQSLLHSSLRKSCSPADSATAAPGDPQGEMPGKSCPGSRSGDPAVRIVLFKPPSLW